MRKIVNKSPHHQSRFSSKWERIGRKGLTAEILGFVKLLRIGGG